MEKNLEQEQRDLSKNRDEKKHTLMNFVDASAAKLNAAISTAKRNAGKKGEAVVGAAKKFSDLIVQIEAKVKAAEARAEGSVEKADELKDDLGDTLESLIQDYKDDIKTLKYTVFDHIIDCNFYTS